MRILRTPQRLVPYVLAFGFALLSNYFFTGEWLSRFNEVSNEVWTWRHTLATGFLLAGIALAAIIFGRRDDFPVGGVRADRVNLHRIGVSRDWVLLAPSLGCYTGATLLYLIRGESEAVRMIWVASVVLLIVPLFKNSRFSDFWTFEFWEYALLGLIVTIAFTLRYVDLTSIPQHMANDVAIMGLKSRDMLAADDHSWIGMVDTDHQASEHQLIMLSMRLFGVSHYGLTMLSVVVGTASVAVVHYLGRIMFNRWVGLIAAALLAIEYVPVHFSRLIFGPITTFFVLLGALYMVHGIKRNSRLSFALSGVGYGLGLLGYYSGRVGVVIVIAMAVVWFWRRDRSDPVPASSWLLLGAGMLFTFGPNLAYGIENFIQFNGRGNSVILWNAKPWAYSHEIYASGGSSAVVIKEQVRRALLTPFYFHDASTICGIPKPMLSSLTAISFALGLGYCVRRFFSITSALPLLWVGFTFLLGGVLTVDPPFWPHLNIALPAITLIAAVGAERLARRVILEGGRRMVVIIPLVLVVGICFTGINNWEVYYQFQRDYGNSRSRAMRQIQAITSSIDYRVFIVSRDIRWDHEIHRFFLKEVDGHDLSETALYQKLPVIDKPTAFVVHEDTDYKRCVSYLTEAFPGAIRRAFKANGLGFTIIRVFPPGYVEPPDDFSPAPLMWNSAGWRYVFAVLLVVICVGWMTLHRELQERKRGRAENRL
jgi:4-amino-4-deoxy-L-arabinose transferase-like glycosyltransferase